jgi:hypothetical protein
MVHGGSLLANRTNEVVPHADGGSDLILADRQLKRMQQFVWIVLAVWLVIVLTLGAQGAFVVPAGTPPYPIAIGVVAPVLLFLAAVWVTSAFRSIVLAADLPLLTAVQAWRFAGFGFLALFTYGVLPGSFAWPAGLGDMAIGLTAPWLALTLARRPAFAASRLFVVWNLLGMLDLISAVSTASVNQVHATGASGEVTAAPMAQLPLLLVPAYLVPLFFIGHVTALLQARRFASVEPPLPIGASAAGRHPEADAGASSQELSHAPRIAAGPHFSGHPR